MNTIVCKYFFSHVTLETAESWLEALAVYHSSRQALTRCTFYNVTMLSGLREETNPLYYIVILTTGLWLLSFVVPPVVNQLNIVSEYFLAVFAIWAVMPVAMAFDVGILRQKFALPARYSILSRSHRVRGSVCLEWMCSQPKQTAR